MLAAETMVTYASIGNKFSVKEMIYQLVDEYNYEILSDRLD